MTPIELFSCVQRECPLIRWTRHGLGDYLLSLMKRIRTGVLLLLPFLITAAHADGSLLIDLNNNSQDWGASLVRAPDGRLYVGAYVQSAVSQTTGVVLAFTADGAPVTGFGTAGRVDGQYPPIAAAVRPDGAYVFASGNRVTTLSPTGSPVASFVTPHVCPTAGCGDVTVNSLVTLPDNTALALGGFVRGGVNHFDPSSVNSDNWTVSRINADGTSDAAFGGGAGFLNIAGSDGYQIMTSARLSNGKIITNGRTRSSSIPGSILGLLNADGSLDTSFSTNGFIILPDGVNPWIPSVGEDSVGRILNGSAQRLVERRATDGTLDNGYVSITPLSGNLGWANLAIDSQDRVVVFGSRDTEAYVARFLPDGGYDPSFGTGGEAIIQASIASTPISVVNAGLVDDVDRPVILLTVASPTGAYNLALVRLTDAGVLDTAFAAGQPDADSGTDLVPDAFTFTDQADVALDTQVTSNAITVAGITHPTPVAVQNGSYSIGCNSTYTTANGMVSATQTICVRHTSSASFATATETVLTIGGVSDTFTSTTLAGDTTPDAFAFTAQSNVSEGTSIRSNTVTIEGINSAAPISVTNGEYSLGCDATFTSAAGTITSGQTVCVRHISSNQPNTTVTTTLNVGGSTAAFASTTAPSPTPITTPKKSGGAISPIELAAMLALILGVVAGRKHHPPRAPLRVTRRL
jgi:uncharacterized delta-60 repeat protein